VSDVQWESGQRVVFKDRKGNEFAGVVDVQKRGWVMVDLDGAFETGQGWAASKMMIKATDLAAEDN
jgi:hypothetical protein